MNNAEFDRVIHAPIRLQICALLANVSEMEFQPLKAHLEVSDSVLSKHLKVLEESDYIDISKQRAETGHKRTWLSLTALGRSAYQGHKAALHALIGNISH
ncbi:transcriptional regulator [Pseudoalteromonas sp. MMG013]|uniref:transcriptional regulator n=1 Tax=Pseudoalteromonas sp. MMG013 TaxID=2822687 RepID=UPI001B390754|nr:transcriptional regulator [Pseudoalteromonas sp. MMG013]MBQ4861617.1 transcriptional regulator [Pseudoalteromonas sp. MMG013]